MIVDNPNSHFIFIFHPKIYQGKTYTVYEGKELTNSEVLQYWGKWLVLAEIERLHDLARKLDPWVEEEKIPCIKFDRQPSANLGLKECVMMVYCDKRQSKDVWQILQQHGIKLKAWVSEKETMEMWMPKGPLLERWMQSMNFDKETREAIRADANEKLRAVFDHPDKIYFPWSQ